MSYSKALAKLYKIGDFVKIMPPSYFLAVRKLYGGENSLSWGPIPYIKVDMFKYCNKIAKIIDVESDMWYYIDLDYARFAWSDWMICGKVLGHDDQLLLDFDLGDGMLDRIIKVEVTCPECETYFETYTTTPGLNGVWANCPECGCDQDMYIVKRFGRKSDRS